MIDLIHTHTYEFIFKKNYNILLYSRINNNKNINKQ